MKRKFMAVLATAVLVSSITACGSTSSNNDTVQEYKNDYVQSESTLDELIGNETTENAEDTEIKNTINNTIKTASSSGICGSNSKWYYNNGILVITGTGAVTDNNWLDNTLIDISWLYVDEGIESLEIELEYTGSERSKLSKVVLPSTLKKIGNLVFDDCDSLESIVIPDSVTSIGERAFWSCSSLKSIKIPSSVTSIGDYAFEACTEFTEIEIPNSVTTIGDYAFLECRSLTSITIPSSVSSIGEGVFNYCDSLEKISVSTDNSTYDSRENCNAIIETATNTLIAGCNSTIIPKSVTSIGNEAFRLCFSLTNITIPDGVTSIGEQVFRNCSSLTNITISDSVTSIGEQAFAECGSLTSITIPDGVTSISGSTFNNCSSLTSIIIPDSVNSIDHTAFANCSNLTSITIPDSVTSIGGSAFLDCDNLSQISWNGNNYSTVDEFIGAFIKAGYTIE